MDGTVTEMRGYPAAFFKQVASRPDSSAPRKAATAGGKPARLTSSSRKVFVTAPIKAAQTARFRGLLNISEKPNTPPKLASSRSTISSGIVSDSGGTCTGCRCSSMAMIHAVSVATRMMRMA